MHTSLRAALPSFVEPAAGAVDTDPADGWSPPATARGLQRPRLDTARAPVHVVLGRRPGRQAATLKERLADHAALAGRVVRWHQVEHGSAVPLLALAAVSAAQRQGGIVVAAGGDGTINAVAQAAWGQGVPMGAVCGGTFNYFCRQQSLPTDPEAGLAELMAALAEGELRPVQVSLVNDQLFLVNASVGLYPQLLAEREHATRRFGRHRAVALAAGALSLLRPAPAQRLRLLQRSPQGAVSQRDREVSTLFVGNNALQFEQVGLPEADAIAQGAMGAVMLRPEGRLAMARLLWRAATGRLGDDPAVESFACTRLEAQAQGWRLQPRVKVAFDGEHRWMRLPLRFAVGPRPLWLVAPPWRAPADGTASEPR